MCNQWSQPRCSTMLYVHVLPAPPSRCCHRDASKRRSKQRPPRRPGRYIPTWRKLLGKMIETCRKTWRISYFTEIHLKESTWGSTWCRLSSHLILPLRLACYQPWAKQHVQGRNDPVHTWFKPQFDGSDFNIENCWFVNPPSHVLKFKLSFCVTSVPVRQNIARKTQPETRFRKHVVRLRKHV